MNDARRRAKDLEEFENKLAENGVNSEDNADEMQSDNDKSDEKFDTTKM